MNIKSEQIEVFPCTNRLVASGAKNVLQQSMTSEYSLSSIINKFIDTDGFIISENLENGLAFNIHGYYFNIDSLGLKSILENEDFSKVLKLYAWFKVESLDTTHKFTTIIGQDDNNGTTIWKYKGLNIEASVPTSTTEIIYSLPILQRNTIEEEFKIIPESRQKFRLGSYGYQTMDGGELSQN